MIKANEFMINPKVSVIIPTYNRCKYVQEAIDSVLTQTYQSLEVFVIDDGSTDGSRDILPNKYYDRVQYYWQENQGESAARNHGLGLAKGQYIAFLDSDDIWSPKKIATQVAVLEEKKHQQAVAVCSSVWRIDEKGKQIDTTPVGRAKELSKRKLSDYFSGSKIYAPPSNLLIRSKAIKEIAGFDEEIQYGEDWDLLIRLRQLGEIVFIDQPLLYYRVHSSGQQGIPKPEKITIVLAEHLRIIQKNALVLGVEKEKFVKDARVVEYEKAAYWSFARELWLEGIGYLLEAVSINQTSLSIQHLASNIGYWSVFGMVGRGMSSEQAEDYLLMTFIPALAEHWHSSLGKFPQKKILGYLYHNLAFLIENNNRERKKHLLLKSIKNRPAYIFSPGTIVAYLDG